MVACWKGSHGRSELEAAANDTSDEERSKIATALLAVAWYRGEGQFTKDENMCNMYGSQAFDWLQSKALEPTDDLISAGSVEPKPYALSTLATTFTAYLLRDGIGVAVNAELAAQYMKAAVPYGNLISQFLMAYALCEGEGLDAQDDERGIQFYRLAAAQGHPTALYNLGVQYLNGEGVQKDETEASMFFKRAAECGYGSACAEYGESLYFGRGIPQDYQESFRYLTEAYEKGEKGPCYLLAFFYLNGDGGVDVDRQMAKRMMEIAKDSGAERAITSWEDTFKDIDD
ncbi:sel1 repeat family protein [archaeon]|nr:MAG: sel1 repeat family protein [archaeon]